MLDVYNKISKEILDKEAEKYIKFEKLFLSFSDIIIDINNKLNLIRFFLFYFNILYIIFHFLLFFIFDKRTFNSASSISRDSKSSISSSNDFINSLALSIMFFFLEAYYFIFSSLFCLFPSSYNFLFHLFYFLFFIFNKRGSIKHPLHLKLLKELFY